MTGHDTIVARHLYGNPFEFEPQFKLFLGTNHKPRIYGNDHALWRRLKLIPFDVRIPEEEQDRKLGDRLKSEYSGILNWTLEGMKAWQSDGLGHDKDVDAATTEYRESMDVLHDFITERCVEKPAAEVSNKDLYEAYKNWAENTNNKPLSMRSFVARLEDRNLDSYKSAHGKVWLGLKLK